MNRKSRPKFDIKIWISNFDLFLFIIRKIKKLEFCYLIEVGIWFWIKLS